MSSTVFRALLFRALLVSNPVSFRDYCRFPAADYLAQLYMVAKASREETGKQAGEGIEILKNEPFDAKSPCNKYKMPPGQYT